MADLTDKLADVIGKNVSQPPRGIAHAIIAALPGMVKPLEWWLGDGNTESVCGKYAVYELRSGLWRAVFYGDDPRRLGDVASRDEAIAAANAHHRAAIMAALGVGVK